MRTVDVGVVRAVGANALQVVVDSNAIGIRDFILLYIFVVILNCLLRFLFYYGSSIDMNEIKMHIRKVDL